MYPPMDEKLFWLLFTVVEFVQDERNLLLSVSY